MPAQRSRIDRLSVAETTRPDSEQDSSIYDAIREAILNGRYHPGDRLVESRLAAEFGVSRTRIRDALARLEADHLVSSAPNRGRIVRPLTQRDIEEIYQLRLLLEGYAASLSADHITTRELDELRALHARMTELERAEGAGVEASPERMGLIRAVADINNEFHRIIHRASRNTRLESILRTVIERPLVFQSFYWYSDRGMAESLAEHAELLDTLQAHDPVATQATMRRHISRGMNTLLREMPRF
jgi:DNA-binding GntR family transcriptional regulator